MEQMIQTQYRRVPRQYGRSGYWACNHCGCNARTIRKIRHAADCRGRKETEVEEKKVKGTCIGCGKDTKDGFKTGMTMDFKKIPLSVICRRCYEIRRQDFTREVPESDYNRRLGESKDR